MRNAYYTVMLGLDKMRATVMLVKARNMVSKLTGNPRYTTPVPALSEVSLTADGLEESINAYELNPGPGERIDREISMEKMKGTLVELGGYIQAASNGDLEAIKSAGCAVRRTGVPIGPLPAPKKVVARVTAYPGILDVYWGGVHGRSMYELEMCAGDPTVDSNWKVLVVTSKNRFTVEKLTSNDVYFFRVRAFGTAGYSPMSDIAQAKAA